MTTPTTPDSSSTKSTDKIEDHDRQVGAMLSQEQMSLQKLIQFRQSDEGKRFVGWVREKYDQMKTERFSVQRQWYMNLAMFYGNQYLTFVQTSGGYFKLGTPKAPRHRVRSITNKIRPIVRTEISRLTSQKPNASVMPASTEETDIMAAHAAEQLWTSNMAPRLNRLLVRNAFWSSITGNGFLKTWWDNSKLDRVQISPDGQPAQGIIEHGVVTPFNIFVPDLLEEEIEDQPFVLQAYTKSVEWVKQFWGDIVENPKPTAKSNNEIFDMSYMLPGTGGTQNAKPDTCLVLEVYIKPGAHPLFREGGMATIVNEELVQFYNEKMPYNHDQYPIAHNISVPTGKFYGDSVLVDVNSLQKEYNRTRSQIIESKNRSARPQLLVAKGSLDVNKLTSEPGLIIPYNPGLPPPAPLQMTPIPNYVINELEVIKADIEDISGQHQVSRGQSPGGGVEAATAISYLQEKDDSLLSSTYSSLENAIEKVARQSLQLVVDYWTTERIIKVTGTDNSFDSIELKGSDIANGIDLRIEAGSSLPTSKPARQALLMDMAKSGFLEPNKMFELLEMGGFNKLVDEIRIDTKAAQRENLRMKKLTAQEVQFAQQQFEMVSIQGGEGSTDPNTGLPLMQPPIVPVNSWDNHAEHIRVHNAFRKSQEFEFLDDLVKAEFERHVQTHQVQINNLAMQNAQLGIQPDVPGGMMQGMQQGGSGGGMDTMSQSM